MKRLVFAMLLVLTAATAVAYAQTSTLKPGQMMTAYVTYAAPRGCQSYSIASLSKKHSVTIDGISIPNVTDLTAAERNQGITVLVEVRGSKVRILRSTGGTARLRKASEEAAREFSFQTKTRRPVRLSISYYFS